MCKDGFCSCCRPAKFDGCIPNCARILFIITNTILWIMGVVLLAVGVWFMADSSIRGILDWGLVDEEAPFLQYAIYIVIFVGILIVVLGLCGCFGAIKLNKVLLGIYLACVLFIGIALIIASSFAIVQHDTMIEGMKNKTSAVMTQQLQTDSYPENYAFMIHSLQQSFSCCGIDGPTTYHNSSFANDTQKNLPWSCCVIQPSKADVAVAARSSADVEQCQLLYTPNQPATWRINATSTYTTGCFDALQEGFSSKAIIFIGIGLGLVFFLLFTIIFTVCLLRFIDEEYVYMDED